MLFCILGCRAQIVLDHFNVGPYMVDYIGPGDVKFRLMDGIDLYEFFELRRDTVIDAERIANQVAETPQDLRHAIQISGKVGANRFASKEIGLEVIWKQNIGTNLYFNGGLSPVIGHSNFSLYFKRNMLEIGVPLQIEFGRPNTVKSSLYGTIGITPAYYSTINTKYWKKNEWKGGDNKASGFLISPVLEFGGYIPLGPAIMRIGVYGTYKINCTPGDYDVYSHEAGRCFLGAKLGIVL